MKVYLYTFASIACIVLAAEIDKALHLGAPTLHIVALFAGGFFFARSLYAIEH